MIVLHHLETSRSQRILWALEELGVPYELKVYKRDPKTRLAPPELKKIHPLGRSPILVDDDKTFVESAVILEYLVETYGKGKFVPQRDTPEYHRYRFWMHFAEGTAMPPLVMKLVFTSVKKRAPFLIRPIAKAIAGSVEEGFIHPQLATNARYIEAELAKTTWFAGNELTAADFQMSFPMEASFSRFEDGNRPKSKEWLDRVRARPAYQRALEKGGPVVMR